MRMLNIMPTPDPLLAGLSRNKSLTPAAPLGKLKFGTKFAHVFPLSRNFSKILNHVGVDGHKKTGWVYPHRDPRSHRGYFRLGCHSRYAIPEIHRSGL